MKQALGLIRVSTDAQDVQRQRTDLKKLEKMYGIHIVRTLELVGVSGTTMLTNQQTRQLLREVAQPGIDGLAASSVDRVIRPKRGRDFGILDELQDEKKHLWTVRDGHMDLGTPEGWERAMAASLRAGSELQEILRRVRDGKAEKKAKGRAVNGDNALPDGLRFDKRTGWSYEPVELAKITKAYQALFEDRYSLSEIERLVGWPRGRIRTLKNATWKGLRVYPPTADREEPLEVPLPLQPVLTEEQWNRAQALLAKRKTWSKATADLRHLGAGLLACECHNRYYSHCDKRRGKHDSYHCASRQGGRGCGVARLRRLAVDAAIVRIVEEYLTDAKFLKAIFQRLEQTPQPDTCVEREKELAKLAARRKKWIEQYDAERITKQEFEEKMDAAQKAIRALEVSMPVAPPPLPDYSAVTAGLVETLASFRTLPFLEQRTALKLVVRSFQVIDGTIPEITLSGAFLASAAGTNSAQRS
jgi:DNA invertase Pin-like site-specific DNA recombinase